MELVMIGSGWERDAAGRLDGVDAEILSGIRDLFNDADPPPRHLVERIQFAVELEDVSVEVFRLGLDRDLAVATRGEQSRTITFDSDSMSIMIRISASDHERVRVDGWLAPPAARSVELRTSAQPLQTEADDQGRFAFEEVRHGLVQLAVHVVEDDDTPVRRRLVVTPSIEV
jgi:hypothetical protein